MFTSPILLSICASCVDIPSSTLSISLWSLVFMSLTERLQEKITIIKVWMTNTLKFTTVNDSQNKNTEYHLRIKILKNITVTKSTDKFFNWYLSYIWIDNLPVHFLFCLVHCISKWLGCKCVYFDRVRQTTDYYFTPLLDLKNLSSYFMLPITSAASQHNQSKFLWSSIKSAFYATFSYFLHFHSRAFYKAYKS